MALVAFNTHFVPQLQIVILKRFVSFFNAASSSVFADRPGKRALNRAILTDNQLPHKIRFAAKPHQSK
ncbi:MAG: hypothetical protein R3C26_03530 [Calditrichia bacterium]